MDINELRSAIKAFVDTLEVDTENFYYNESNDYGRISIPLPTVEGDPFQRFAGEACMSEYIGRGIRPNGRHRLNEAFVDWLLEQILIAQSKQIEETP